MFNPFKKKRFEIDDFAKLVIAEAKKAGLAQSLEYDPKRSHRLISASPPERNDQRG